MYNNHTITLLFKGGSRPSGVGGGGGGGGGTPGPGGGAGAPGLKNFGLKIGGRAPPLDPPLLFH